MSDIKQQIFQELSALENAVARLNGVAVNASKQTDLEVAILTQQVHTLREKNKQAGHIIDEATGILKRLV